MASGCTGIYKPAELTPLSALKLAEILHSTEGVVPGAFNFVSGLGEVAGHHLTGHPDVRKIAYTGGTEKGKKILARCAETLKSTTMELGGKSPFIVYEDADLEKAAEYLANFYIVTSGQFCASPTRAYIQESVYDKFIDLLVQRVKKHKVGAFTEDNVSMGPVISEDHLQKILGYIESARKEGATIATGGNRINRPGFFVEPTVITNAHNDMKAVREEIFGPVVCCMKFKDMDEAIKLANDNDYGLSGGVFSTDPKKIYWTERKVKTGGLFVNHYWGTAVDPTYLFGGVKYSGIGRELGQDGIENFLVKKSVSHDYN